MAQRPIVTSLLAVTIAAAAIRTSRPSLPGPNLTNESTETALTPAASVEQASWTKQLEAHPELAGAEAARSELYAKICGFVSAPVCASDSAPPLDPEPPQVMIAIAPDPIHTHLSLVFDREIDAIEEALQDGGWTYQGYWLPWASQPISETGEFKSREIQQLYLNGRRQYPGVILFRPSLSNERKRQPLLVFVAGDSPTGGINPSQFRRAIDLASKIGTNQNQQLNILGPSFTGSGPSFVSLLGEAKRSALSSWSLKIASGQLSDWECKHFLPDAPEGPPPGDHCTDKRNPEDTFVSFGVDANWENQQVEQYLETKGRFCPYQIAELTEGESGFGSLGREPNKPKDQRAKEDGTGKVNEDKLPDYCRKDISDGILKLTFPRNISHLRTAYQKNSIWGFGGSSSGPGSVSLSLDFEEPHQGDDTVPTFARQQMPVSQEGSMGQVASMLEQRGIKAVFVSATDVLDLIFVTQMLARQAPNLTVIVKGADVFFLRSGQGGAYYNMYAVSPWPLIPKNYVWRKKISEGPPIHNFASGDTQGVYTATRYLISSSTGTDKQSAADDIDYLQDYSSPIQPGTDRPPLWLLSVGRGAYWPFALLEDPSKWNDVPRSPNNLPRIPQAGTPVGLSTEPSFSVPLSQRLGIFVACLLTLLHAGKCLEWKPLANFAYRYQVTDKTTGGPKLCLQLAITILGMMMLSLMYPHIQNPDKQYLFWALPIIFGMVVLSLAAAHICSGLFSLPSRPKQISMGRLPKLSRFNRRMLRQLWRWFGPFQRNYVITQHPIRLTLAFLLLSFALWFALWQWLPITSLVPAEGLRAFFLYRCQYPLSGTSPVFPLLLALNGIALVLLGNLSRFTFGRSLRPRLPEDVQFIPNLPNESSMQPLVNLITWPPLGRTWKARMKSLEQKLVMFLLTLSATLLISIAMPISPKILDGWHLTLALDNAMFLVLLFLLWDLFMGALIWRQLKTLCLDRLESSSLRRGFNSIHGLTWKTLWLMPQSGLVQYRAFMRALEQASRTVLAKQAGSPPGKSLIDATNEMWQRRAAPKPVVQEIVDAFGLVQDRAARTAEQLLLELRQSWKDEAGLITGSDHTPVAEIEEKPKDEEKTKDKDKDTTIVPSHKAIQRIQEEWIALIYIHYIRMILIQIRSRLSTAAMLYLLLVWSVTSYPYMNRHILVSALTALLGVLAFVVVATYASINRDPILSRATDHEPGKLDFDFYVKTASMVGIPLLGFVASQFPEVSKFLFSWIEPGMAGGK